MGLGYGQPGIDVNPNWGHVDIRSTGNGIAIYVCWQLWQHVRRKLAPACVHVEFNDRRKRNGYRDRLYGWPECGNQLRRLQFGNLVLPHSMPHGRLRRTTIGTGNDSGAANEPFKGAMDDMGYLEPGDHRRRRPRPSTIWPRMRWTTTQRMPQRCSTSMPLVAQRSSADRRGLRSLRVSALSAGAVIASSGLNLGGADGSGVQIVPEPGTLSLLLAGAIGLLVFAWRKRK